VTSYIVRRLVQTFFVLIGLSFVTFGLMGLMPGDPLDVACAANPRCTPENLEAMKHNLGLDRPIYERYATWASGFVRGEFGYSRTYRQPVTEIIGPRLLNTFILGSLVILVSLCVAIPIGVLSSLKPNSKFDYLVNFFAFSGVSAPAFWIGLVLIIVFSVKLHWFPASGVETVGLDQALSFTARIVDRLKYLVLPTAALSCLTIAGWVRYTRASMLETMRLDFIRTARAKGLDWKRIVAKHGFRNALLPIVTVVALDIPTVVSGAVITETVFAYQGVGKLMFDSIIGNDFNVAMCAFILESFVVLAMSLIADIAYAYLDPRITYQ
jgi:peptide/nickel transport system permease protein